MEELLAQYNKCMEELNMLEDAISADFEEFTAEAFKDDAIKALKKAWEEVKKYAKQLYKMLRDIYKRVVSFFKTDVAKFGSPEQASDDIKETIKTVKETGMEDAFKKDVVKTINPKYITPFIVYKPITSDTPILDFKKNTRYIFDAILALSKTQGNGFEELKRIIPATESERAYRLFLNESIGGTYGGDQKDRVASARDYVGFIVGRTIYIIYIGNYDFVYISSKTFSYDGVPEELALDFVEELVKNTNEILPKISETGNQYIEEALEYLDESFRTLTRMIERKDLLELEYGKNNVALGKVMFKLIGWCEKDILQVRISNRKLLRTVHKVTTKEPYNVSIVYQLLTAVLANSSRAHGGVLRATARRLNIPKTLEDILLKVNHAYTVPYMKFFAESSKVKAVVYDNMDARLKLYENETDGYIDYNQYLPLVAFDFTRKRWFVFRSVYDKQLLAVHLKKRHR